jgi:CheY-like chemotaxis protein
MKGVELLNVVLCLENDHVERLVSAFLRSYGLQTVVAVGAGDVAAAKQRMITVDYDLLIVGMASRAGGWFGPELVRWIRRHPDSPNKYFPVLVISAFGDAEAVQSASAAGVHEYIVMPLRMSDLLTKIHRAVFVGRPFVETSDYVGPVRLSVDEEGARRQAAQALIDAGAGRGRSGAKIAR